ncbi:hypothetical protein Tco_0772800 [Tanacetum coccineum]|uniref:MAK10-like protein n=1 Tax=Tanacetum coccineum TaxID=301880 RepID=A0ABQ4ZIX2_9ASTR
MEDENPIRTLGDYSKPSHEGYKNTIELPSKDPNQHLKDFLKLVDSLDLEGSITTWEDLTTHFLAQFFPSGRTVKLRNDILIGPHDTRYCMKDPEQAFVKYTSLRTDEVRGNSMAPKSIAAISQVEREELKKKGIKSPSKLFSLKYLSPASIKELNKNLSSPKRVHFVNSIVVLSKDSDTEEEDISSTNAREHDLENEESERETEEEVAEVFDDETEEEEDDDTKYYNSPPAIKELVYHEWLLENPQPSWVKAKIRAENPSNTKTSCMIGHIFKKHAYIDIESPINIMSRNQYNRIMTYKLGPRKEQSNPNKISNFVGRVRGLRVFIGSFTYKCDFMILEDTTSVIWLFRGIYLWKAIHRRNRPRLQQGRRDNHIQ